MIVADESSTHEQLFAQFNERIRFLPLIDKNKVLTGIAIELPSEHREFSVAGRQIGLLEPCFVIAEIGLNHNGSVPLAKELIDCAIEAGADCVKFQMRDMNSLYVNNGKSDDASADLGAQYILSVLESSNLSQAQMAEVLTYAQNKGITPLCTPWDLPSLAFLEFWGLAGYKISSADLTNHELLRSVAATGKPMIVSTGMSRESEIIESLGVLRLAGAKFALLHCNSTYPAPFKDVNLRYINRLAKISNANVGYSGHERGYAAVIAAVALGASIIEKHITLDRDMIGNDHKVSLEPLEFKSMVNEIRNVESALGSEASRIPSVGEMMNREILAKSLIATCRIPYGVTIDSTMIAVASPGKGLQPNRIKDLIGRVANRDVELGDFFYPTDLSDVVFKPRNFKFSRPWGIPVRFHDWRKLHQNLQMNFLEFHLSYKDLEVDLGRFFEEKLPLGLIVHSPDLFENDHILNLASDDELYRKMSVRHLQSVIDVARSLKNWFPNVDRIPLVVSLGGMSRNAPIKKAQIPEMYKRVAQSLSLLNTEGVQILPQTLPPFPWYLGGQLHCNLFVDPEDTAEFARSTGLKLCFDISHSKLAANHRGRCFNEYIELLAPLTGHFHIVDAAGIDSEGLQIGDGEIDFDHLAKRLSVLSPNVSFIPEIWQGHKNSGEGFWVALDRLEGLL